MLNVEEMRDTLTPQQMAKWQAFRRLQPDGIERLIEVCKLGFAVLANIWGASVEPDRFEPANEKRSAASKHQTASPNQAAIIAHVALGNPNGKRNR